MEGPGRFDDVDLAKWTVYDREPAGSKPGKYWMVPPDEPKARWLWKPRTLQRHIDETFWKGEDWAEKLVSEMARLINVPVAAVDLAHRGEQLGTISRSVAEGRDLALGNQVLANYTPDYRMSERTDREHYSLRHIFEALDALGVTTVDVVTDDPKALFASYLVLDALTGNTDRHHENWGVLVDPAQQHAPVLAASFDHASSLGFQLSDERRREVIEGRGGWSITGYARGGRSRHFVGNPGLVELAAEAHRQCGSLWCVDALADLTREDLDEVVDAVPPDRMSHPARTFVVRLVSENRRRLLDELDHRG